MFKSQGIMADKVGIIMGIANEKSIGYGIASAVINQGACLGLSYQNKALEKRLAKIALNLSLIAEDVWYAPCDVSSKESIEAFFNKVKSRFNRIDFLVHAIAYSDKRELRGEYLQTSRENFLHTMNISCYSLLEIIRSARPLFIPGSAIVTLSYFGAEKMIPNYNIMGVAKAALESSVRYLASDLGRDGVRINALSAGPIRTLAASGIEQFKDLLHWQKINAPLKRNITLEDIGGASIYLCSSLSSAVTGEVHHVDSGSHCCGMRHAEFDDETADQLYQNCM